MQNTNAMIMNTIYMTGQKSRRTIYKFTTSVVEQINDKTFIVLIEIRISITMRSCSRAENYFNVSNNSIFSVLVSLIFEYTKYNLKLLKVNTHILHTKD